MKHLGVTCAALLNKPSFVVSALFLFVLSGFSFFAQAAECDRIIGSKVCEDVNDSSACTDATRDEIISWNCASASDYVSAKLPPGSAFYAIDVPVDDAGSMACRYANNTSSSSYFVPFRTWQEWGAFIANHPSDIQLSFCGRPTQFIVRPDLTKCNKPNLIKAVAYVPSGRVNVLEYKKQNFAKNYIVAFKCSGNNVTKGLEIFSINYRVAPRSFSGGRASNDVAYIPRTWVTDSNANASGWIQLETSSVVLGGCGSAYNTPVAGNLSSPVGTLCAVDRAATGVNVESDTPAIDAVPQWKWTCTQLGTTTTPQNSASVTCTAPIGAACGPANGTLVSVQPSGDSYLCAWGTPQNIASQIADGKHIWTWQCACGKTCTPGYGTANCSATDSVAAQCGTANGQSLTTAPSSTPSSNLCFGGIASSVIAKGAGGMTGPWSWTCTGTSQVSCSANLSSGCGSVNGKVFTADTAPSISTPNLCVDGNTASNFNGSGPWHWTCTGSGGDTANCSALLKTSGVCGSDNGRNLGSAPTNLCNPESSPPVTKVAGGWTWRCPGENGGNAANCSASELPAGPACGPGAFLQITCPDDRIDSVPPSTNEGKCSYGTPSEISRKTAGTSSSDRDYYSGRVYWEWTCSAGGSSVTCQLPLCSCAMCGEAFNNTTSGGSSSAPSGLTSYQLCMNGAFDQNYQFKTVTTNRSMPYYNPNWSEWWTWKCKLIRDDGSTNSHTCHLPKR